MDQVVPVIVALVLVAIAWKVLKGIVKTMALVAVLAFAALWVWQAGGFS